MVTIAAMAAQATSMAVLRAVHQAKGLRFPDLWLPALADMPVNP